MKHVAISMLAAFLAITPTVTRAAKAPVSPEGLEKEATHIVTGKVAKVASRTQKSKVEKALGIHRDRVFTITLKVGQVVKGVDVKTGGQIEIEAWQPSKRIPPCLDCRDMQPYPRKMIR